MTVEQLITELRKHNKDEQVLACITEGFTDIKGIYKDTGDFLIIDCQWNEKCVDK